MTFLTSINSGRNIKDIAKLRGSEDLWEVAKLHDRESSFPGVYLLTSANLHSIFTQEITLLLIALKRVLIINYLPINISKF